MIKPKEWLILRYSQDFMYILLLYAHILSHFLAIAKVFLYLITNYSLSNYLSLTVFLSHYISIS